MESIFDGLIEFKTKEELKEFVNTIDKDHAIKVIEMALEYSHKSGIFTIEEAHVIYTCLSKLKSNEDENNSLRGNNDNGVTNP